MKTWLFALVESVIVLLGLAAYFFAGNTVLAAAAVVLAACMGIFQSLHSAHAKQKLDAYQEQQFQKSVDAVDEQLQALLDELIDPPFPHRATVSARLRHQYGDGANELLGEYDRVVQAITDGSSQAVVLAEAFADRLPQSSVGSYLLGLASLVDDDLETAHRHFVASREANPAWIAPWLGWATAAYRQSRWDEIREHHPHLNGVEMLPYDAGDEQTFLELSEEERETVTDGFQAAARSLGNYYAIAETCRSKDQLIDSRAEYQKAA